MVLLRIGTLLRETEYSPDCIRANIGSLFADFISALVSIPDILLISSLPYLVGLEISEGCLYVGPWVVLELQKDDAIFNLTSGFQLRSL